MHQASVTSKKNTFTSLTYEFSLFGLAIPIEANDVAQCQIWKKQDNHTCQAKKAYTIKQHCFVKLSWEASTCNPTKPI